MTGKKKIKIYCLTAFILIDWHSWLTYGLAPYHNYYISCLWNTWNNLDNCFDRQFWLNDWKLWWIDWQSWLVEKDFEWLTGNNVKQSWLIYKLFDCLELMTINLVEQFWLTVLIEWLTIMLDWLTALLIEYFDRNGLEWLTRDYVKQSWLTNGLDW